MEAPARTAEGGKLVSEGGVVEGSDATAAGIVFHPPEVSLSGRYDTLAVCVLGPQGTCPQTLAAFPLSM